MQPIEIARMRNHTQSTATCAMRHSGMRLAGVQKNGEPPGLRLKTGCNGSRWNLFGCFLARGARSVLKMSARCIHIVGCDVIEIEIEIAIEIERLNSF